MSQSDQPGLSADALIDQMFTLWIVPNVEASNLNITRDQVVQALVVLHPNGAPEVKLNEQAELLATVQVRDAVVQGLVRRYVAEQLGDRELRVAALDESGQEKQGEHTAGAKRQYMGCACPVRTDLSEGRPLASATTSRPGRKSGVLSGATCPIL
nr:hypothetical protein [Kibdelosporangium sp. MJ126-NF4]CTQ99120.1 hypothetical protein [Kibdelosporangium sp. MJ126-NF4]